MSRAATQTVAVDVRRELATLFEQLAPRIDAAGAEVRIEPDLPWIPTTSS